MPSVILYNLSTWFFNPYLKPLTKRGKLIARYSTCKIKLEFVQERYLIGCKYMKINSLKYKLLMIDHCFYVGLQVFLDTYLLHLSILPDMHLFLPIITYFFVVKPTTYWTNQNMLHQTLKKAQEEINNAKIPINKNFQG